MPEVNPVSAPKFGAVAVPVGASEGIAPPTPPDAAGLSDAVNHAMFTFYNDAQRQDALQSAIRGDRTPGDAVAIIDGVQNAMWTFYNMDQRMSVLTAGLAGPYTPPQIFDTINSLTHSMWMSPEQDRVNTMIATLGPRA